MKYLLIFLAAIAPALAGCESNIRPLRPVQRVELWVPDDGSPAIQLSRPVNVEAAHPAVATTVPADVHPVNIADSQPATAPASTQNAAGEAASQPAVADTGNLPPGHKIVRIIDPNQTTRYVYNATYDNVWQQAILIVHKLGFELEQQDYRLGILHTKSLPSAQLVEFWKPQHSDFTNAAENTINTQRRYLKLTISKAPKPNFYEIGVQVLVERETNPTETITGPLFIEGSGFGRNAVSLRSDYADPSNTSGVSKSRREGGRFGHSTIQPDRPPPITWQIIGHDPSLEKKVLDQLFQRI